MMRYVQTVTHCLVFMVFALTATPVIARESTSDTIPLYSNLGPYTRPVTTSSSLAQRYFNQGLRLAYAFGRPQAVRSFREAQRHDPHCAMCYWGEAWALGPYINEKMDPKAGVQAYQAIQKAKGLVPQQTNANEQALIEAMALRYAPDPTPENRATLDRAYAAAMGEVVRRFPQDLDAGALFGEALMVLSPWDHWTREGQPKPGTEEAVAVLESILARNIKHPGACHLYIHLMEASPTPEQAEACADLLADQIPGASHIQHMPSHIYMHIARYGDAVRTNQNAWQVDQQAAHDQAIAIYPAHNLHMLIYAGWMDGQSAVALQAARDLAKLSPDNAFYPSLILTRFGRWDEVLALSQPEDAFQQGFWHFAQGMAHLQKAHPDKAHLHLDHLTRIAQATPDSLTYWYFGKIHQADLLTIAQGILEGELATFEGRDDDAVQALEQAVSLEDSLAYAEPEPWPLPVRQVLGAVLLELDQPVQAERVYREDLEDHPHNGWSLIGLAQSLEAQDKPKQATEARSAFEKAWARADVWLPASRF